MTQVTTDYGAMEALDIVAKDYGKHTPIDLRVAEILISNFGGNGSTRVYATYRDGVYKGQITSVKSLEYLHELLSAYAVDLTACTTGIFDNILIVRAK